MLSKTSVVTGIVAAAALLVTPVAQAADSGHYGHSGQESRPHHKFMKDDAFSNNNINFGDQYCANAQGSEGGILNAALGTIVQTLSPVTGAAATPGSNKGNDGQVLSPQTNACVNGSHGSASGVEF